METLVVNIGLIPVSIVPCRRAISLIASDKAIALANYENEFYHSSNFVLALPSVIKCTKSNYVPRHFTNVLPFTRKNVYIRDGGCCMYCGKKVSLSEFTFDHVVAKDKGGKVWWDNIVVSCTRCNGQKGNKSLHRYKRQLIRAPYIPKLSKAAPAHVVRKLSSEIPHETWLDYIYWNIELVTQNN
jgi:5-methylcytosine-specific restriction endonuclease McrA